MSTVKAAVVTAVNEVCGIDEVDLTETATLGELGIDSLDLLEVAMIVEQETGIVVQADDFDEVETFAAAVRVFEQLHVGHVG